ncbi:amidohydrolase family protein [Thalassotalea agariperforans]
MAADIQSTKLNIIDPHIHLFDLNQGDYHWLKSANPPFWPDKHLIQQNFSEADLSLSNNLQLAGFVHIEAGFDNKQPWRELHWLEQTCKLPFRSIAFIDINQSPINFTLELTKLSQFSSFVGVRYIFEDDNTLTTLSKEQVLTNLKLLAERALIFELQMPFDNIDAIKLISQLLTQLPKLKVIINHGGFPEPDSESQFKQWQTVIQQFSQFSCCAIKCSGWEMQNRHYTVNWQEKVINHCLACFGEDRVMLASNFPLTLFSQPYPAYWQAYAEQLTLAPKLLEKLCFTNSYHWYNFDNLF